MSGNITKEDREYIYTQNRDLSWLKFNRRVLEEAEDKDVPLLERLRFIAIYESNLDEFFRVRVGRTDACKLYGEMDVNSGKTPQKLLNEIYNTVREQIEDKKKVYDDLSDELEKIGVKDVDVNSLTDEERKIVEDYYNQNISALLSPMIIGPHHPLPVLVNKDIYISVLVKDKKGKEQIGMVSIPKSISPYLMLSKEGRYIRMENIILLYVKELFKGNEVCERCIFSVTRSADIALDERMFNDEEGDFRKKMLSLLRQRDVLSIMRMEVSTDISDDYLRKIERLLGIDGNKVFIDKTPLKADYVYSLIDELPDNIKTANQYQEYVPRWNESLEKSICISEQINKQDKMLFYPYDSTEPFIRLLQESAENPFVRSIKITVYRLASSSKIGEILCQAAENGKDVTVLMELRARFDEYNNIEWSKKLEKSGCRVIYGAKGYKCHSKICLITSVKNGKTEYITQIGTGNYNEKTNKIYTDFCFMTASKEIGEDATHFFQNMLVNNLTGEYQELKVSPYGIKNALTEAIDREIQKGSNGYICMKINSVTDREVIDKLAEASKVGVEIQLIVRGITCLLPGIKDFTENVHITSIVGRFLEHARVYIFGKNEEEQIYISSADLMTRNLENRVEIACPIKDSDIKGMIKHIICGQLRDTAKVCFIRSDGSYCRKKNAVNFDSQDDCIKNPVCTTFERDEDKAGVIKKFNAFLNCFSRKKYSSAHT